MLNHSETRKDWGWENEFDSEKLNMEMIDNLK